MQEERKVDLLRLLNSRISDMKCVCMQYLEAVGRLKAAVSRGEVAPPLRTLHLSFLPDEESGKFANYPAPDHRRY